MQFKTIQGKIMIHIAHVLTRAAQLSISHNQGKSCIFLGLLVLAACGPASDPRVSDTAPVVYQFAIEGMHCQSCVDAITDKAMHTDGVVDCRVNLKEKSAIVAMRDDTVEPQVKTGIEKLGFTVTVVPKTTSTNVTSTGVAATSAPASSAGSDRAPAQPK
jgi:copper chaperone CopZ